MKSPCKYFKLETDLPIYINCLKNPEYFKKQKNMECKIVLMTPEEYFKKSAELHKTTVEEELRMIMSEKKEKIKRLMEKGIKFYLPVLDYTILTQEGRHRIKAAWELGCKVIPVLVVIPVR